MTSGGSSHRKSNGRFRAWFRLVRLPNTLTAASNVVAGAALARPTELAVPPVLVTALAAMAVYAFGIVVNDLRDLEIDRRIHPDRPLVLGTVSRRAALLAAVLLAAAGAAGLVFGAQNIVLPVALIAAVLAYNLLFKSTALAGASMASCRALLPLLGAAAASSGQVPWTNTALGTGAASLFAYIFAITLISRREDEAQPSAARLATGILFASLMVMPIVLGAFWLLPLSVAHGFFVAAPMLAGGAAGKSVRRGVLTLPLVDAAFCFAAHQWELAAVCSTLFLATLLLASILRHRDA